MNNEKYELQAEMLVAHFLYVFLNLLMDGNLLVYLQPKSINGN